MQDAFAHCEALVRSADRDRFLAALFVPVEHRGALHALYAFNIEIARVREVVREPLAGEIRLQWWNDAIEGKAAGEIAANPVAAALLESVARYRLPADLLTGLIAARRFDLYDDPMLSLADLDDYARGTSAAVIELAARVLAPGSLPGLGPLALHAGLAYAIAGLLQAFPRHAARGQLFLPLQVLERHGVQRQEPGAQPATPELRSALAELRGEARRHLEEASRLAEGVADAVTPALLPVAIVRPLLDRMERRDYDPFLPLELSHLRRQWRIWRGARQPARIFA